MLDDFMHNNLPDLNLNQAHQDAILHAQNQSAGQAMRAQQEAAGTLPTEQPHTPEPILPAGVGDAAMNLGLLVKIALEKMFGWWQG